MIYQFTINTIKKKEVSRGQSSHIIINGEYMEKNIKI